MAVQFVMLIESEEFNGEHGRRIDLVPLSRGESHIARRFPVLHAR